MIPYKTFVVAFVFLAGAAESQSNKFGFGCLGLVGGFAGYEIKHYEAAGLNNYVNAYNQLHGDSLMSSMGEFGMLKGYRLGINLLRNRVSGLEYTVKIFYEMMNEVKETQVKGSSSIYTNGLEYKQNVYGAGIELGTPLSKAISWKILELEVTYSNALFYKRTEDINNPVSRIKYSSDKSQLGFNFASGFILFIIDQNISLEGKVGYSEFSVGVMTDEAGNKLTVRENSTEVMENAITKGGLFYGVQFNLSIPL